MKNIRLYLSRYVQAFTLLIGLIPGALYAGAMPGPGDMFNISEADMNQIVEALNDLSPDQLKELEELGRATEERMRQQDLDPNNPNDWMKFMEKEGLMEKQPERPQPAPKPMRKPRPMERPQRPMRPSEPQKAAPIAVTNKADTKAIIEELITHLASLKQKAITRTAIMKRLGSIQDQIDQLSLYLHLVQSPDIITLLSTKEFEGLHNSLSQLHKSFIGLEPSISARERSLILNEDDPYEVLDLAYSSTPEEIEARYADLIAERSPDAVKAQLTSEGCDNKVCSRVVKAAERTFRLINRSYEQLKNPETRAKVDATLTDKISRETSREQTSMRAFDQLFTSMNRAITGGRVIGELNQLLEKHKPQELEQAKAQQQREKEAYDRSKRRVIVPQVKAGRGGRKQAGPYDSFYRKMGQQRYGRPGGGQRQPMRPGGGRRPAPQPKKQAGGKEAAPSGNKGGGGAKPSAKPSAKKDSGQPKKPEKKGAKKSEPKPMTVQPSKEDYKVIGQMSNLEKLLSEISDKKNTLKVEHETRGEKHVEEYKLADIMHDVPVQLTNLSKNANPSSPKTLQRFYEYHKMEELKNQLMKLAPGKGKTLSDPVKEHWKELGPKYGKLIKTWHEEIFNHLDPIPLHNAGVTVNSGKKKLYNLHIPRIDPWKVKANKENEIEEDPRPEPTSPGKIDLGKIRDTVHSIKTYYDNINDAAK